MPDNKLAIVGASGFVGSALCERLFFAGRRDFTAYINNSGNAARIARLALPLQELNLLHTERVVEALAGCSTVVNCSRGDDMVMLRGLRNLLEAAKRNRIKKFIHISSVAIYGDDPPLECRDESCPPAPAGNEYGLLKEKQDRMVLALEKAGIQSYVLCPSNIAGPYSPFVRGLVARLAQGPMPLVDEGRYPCNLIHVDNLVEAILTAERRDDGSGERYFVNETVAVSWKQYFEDMTELLGFRCQFIPVSREAVLPYLSTAQDRHRLVEQLKIALSGEFRSGLMLIPALRKMNDMALKAFTCLPANLQQRLREKLERPVHIQKQQLSPSLDDRYVRVQARRVYHSPAKLGRLLDYQPALTYRRGLETTAAWLRFANVT